MQWKEKIWDIINFIISLLISTLSCWQLHYMANTGEMNSFISITIDLEKFTIKISSWSRTIMNIVKASQIEQTAKI